MPFKCVSTHRHRIKRGPWFESREVHSKIRVQETEFTRSTRSSHVKVKVTFIVYPRVIVTAEVDVVGFTRAIKGLASDND